MAGKITTNSIQLGDSATAAHNFVLQTNVDGTCRLSRGNTGATTQDLFSVNAAGVITPEVGMNSMNSLPAIGATVSADALTLSAARMSINFRSATQSSGDVSAILAAPINIVVPLGATLGTANGVQHQLYVIEMNNAGVAELAVMNAASAKGLNEGRLITTVVLNVDSDSKDVIYSATARTNLPFRIVGKVTSTQATAGVWATAPSMIGGIGGLVMPKRLLQNLRVQTGAVATGTVVIPQDDTIPQITEGDQYMSLAITPTSPTSLLEISALLHHSNSAVNELIIAIFRDAVADALATVSVYAGVATERRTTTLNFSMIAGTTSEIIFRLRSGGSAAGTTTINGNGGARWFGGTIPSNITIKEYAA